MSQGRFVFVALVAAAAVAGAVNVDDSRFPIAAPDGSTFRQDYFYHEEANGWLKFHRVPTTWHDARLTCRLEGARLASPLNQGIYSTMRWLKQASRVRTTYTGVHSMASTTDYLSVEGRHVVEMPIEWGENQPSNTQDAERCLIMGDAGRLADVNCTTVHTYFCYKERIGRMRMNRCGNSDDGYVYDENTYSCYKYHTERTNWNRAHSVCTTEGGYLAVINSEYEAQVIDNLIRDQPRGDYVFIGIVNWYRDERIDPTQWYTVHGQTLEEAGYAGWLPGEPNNQDNIEYCGTLAWNNRIGYADYPCHWEVTFVCEIDEPRSPVWW